MGGAGDPAPAEAARATSGLGSGAGSWRDHPGRGEGEGAAEQRHDGGDDRSEERRVGKECGFRAVDSPIRRKRYDISGLCSDDWLAQPKSDSETYHAVGDST